MLTKLFTSKNGSQSRPTIAELVDRGFDPREGVVDILLIFPPTSIADRYGKEDVGDLGGDLPPLGVGCLAAYLRDRGFGVGILDCCALGLDEEEILRIIHERDPRVIGFSSTTYALPSAISLARRIRADFPEKLTLLGGAHANVAEEHAAQEYPWFDIVVFGADGEETTLEVMETYASKGHSREAFLADHDTQRNIKGIVFRQDGRVIKNFPRPAIANLDDLPFPARDLYPMEKYIPLPNQYKRLPVVHMVVIRGCPCSCTFCDQANVPFVIKPTPAGGCEAPRGPLRRSGTSPSSLGRGRSLSGMTR